MRVPNAGEEFGRYRLERVIGQGGMGIVFAATDPRLHRTVAVKVITGTLASSPEFRARFQAEAESLARLDSPHVIAIFDHDEVDETPYIVTQYVDGTDLATLLAASGALPAQHALRLCAQVARGLSDAHQVGVVHRDVKPGNVLLRGVDTPDLHAFLCDFGIARADGVGGPPPTAVGTIAGTWSYLAPERIAGAPATPISDVYALGCLLFACLTGHPPYRGAEFQVALDHQQAPVAQLPGTSGFVAELNGVLARAMAKDPADRFTSAAALRVELERLAAVAPDDTLDGAPAATSVRQPDRAVPPPPVPPTPMTAPPAGGRRRAGVLAAAMAAVVAVVAGGLVAWWAPWDEQGAGSAEAAGRGTTPADRVAGDLDGDGLGDIALTQWRLDPPLSPLPLRVLTSTGRALEGPAEFPGADGWATRGDVTGDGLDDVVWLDDPDDDELAVHVQPSEGDPWDVSVAVDEEADVALSSAVVGDVTGDGTGDLVLIGDGPGFDVLLVAAGTGDGFEPAEQWWASEGSGGLIWVGEFTGDDTTDVLHEVTDASNDLTVTILGSDGESLRPTAQRTLDSTAIAPIITTWMVGDVTGDGRDELVVVGAGGGSIAVYPIEAGEIGTRTNWHRSDLTIEQRRAHLRSNDLAGSMLSDVDGDGDEDLVQSLEGDDSYRFIVYPSTGSAFDDSTTWGAFDCGSECSDVFFLVD